LTIGLRFNIFYRVLAQVFIEILAVKGVAAMLSVIRLLITVILFVLLSISASAQWERDGEIIRPNIGYMISGEIIIPDENHGAIAFWKTPSEGITGVYGQKIDSAGYQLWEPNGSFLGPTTMMYADQVACSDGQGGGIVAWENYLANFSDIYAQRINRHGELVWGDSGLAITDFSGYEWGVDIVSDGCGGAIIVWLGDVNNIGRLVIQRLDSLGSKLYEENGLYLTDQSYGNPVRPRLAMTSDSDFVCIWIDNRETGLGPGIYAQKFDIDGNLLWDPAGAAIAYDSVMISPTDRMQPGAPDQFGGFYCAWLDYRPHYNHRIYMQHVDANGTLNWGTSGIEVSSGTHNADLYLAIDEDNRAIVCWENGIDNYVACNIIWPEGDQQWPGGIIVLGDIYLFGGLVHSAPGEFEIAGRRSIPARMIAQKFTDIGEFPFGEGGIGFGIENQHGSNLWVTTDGLGGIIVLSKYGTELRIHRVYRNGHIGGDTTTYAAEGPLPKDYNLSFGNYPNPFNSGTLITINSPIDQYVNLTLFDILGRKIRNLPLDKIESGTTLLYLDLSVDQTISSGTYFLVLKAANKTVARKITLLK